MNALRRFSIVVITLLALAACTSSPAPVFRHDLTGGVAPWTHEAFDTEPGKFTFAVFSDLTGGERDRVFEVAVAQLRLLRPELIVNVGDLIEGSTTDRSEVDAQWDSFDRRAGAARAPVFYVGGNHDLTGSFMRRVWQDRLGPNYYHFVYKDVLFLVLDTEDNTATRMQEIFQARTEAIRVFENKGEVAFARTTYANMPELAAGNITDAQSRYFLDVIAANPDVRWTFLFMHKAPWLRPEMQTFAAIEDALANRPYTVFHGHEHAYAYEERRGRDYIQLATTGGVQVPGKTRSMDHVTLVTVSSSGTDIANLLLEGILDRTGQIPLNGDDLCFERALCADPTSQQ